MKRRLHLHFLDVGADSLAQRACEQVRRLSNGLVEADAGRVGGPGADAGSIHQADIVILLYRAGERRQAVHLPPHAGCINWTLPKAGLEADLEVQARTLLRELGISARANPVNRNFAARPIEGVKRITNAASEALATASLGSALHA